MVAELANAYSLRSPVGQPLTTPSEGDPAIIRRNPDDLYKSRLKPWRPSRRSLQQREGQGPGGKVARLLFSDRLDELGFSGTTVEPSAIVEFGIQGAKGKEGHRESIRSVILSSKIRNPLRKCN
jgi:hypothetical protein